MLSVPNYGCSRCFAEVFVIQMIFYVWLCMTAVFCSIINDQVRSNKDETRYKLLYWNKMFLSGILFIHIRIMFFSQGFTDFRHLQWCKWVVCGRFKWCFVIYTYGFFEKQKIALIQNGREKSQSLSNVWKQIVSEWDIIYTHTHNMIDMFCNGSQTFAICNDAKGWSVCDFIANSNEVL